MLLYVMPLLTACIWESGRRRKLKSGRPTPGLASGFGSGPRAKRTQMSLCLGLPALQWRQEGYLPWLLLVLMLDFAKLAVRWEFKWNPRTSRATAACASNEFFVDCDLKHCRDVQSIDEPIPSVSVARPSYVGRWEVNCVARFCYFGAILVVKQEGGRVAARRFEDESIDCPSTASTCIGISCCDLTAPSKGRCSSRDTFKRLRKTGRFVLWPSVFQLTPATHLNHCIFITNCTELW
jgi:hypothetical protein